MTEPDPSINVKQELTELSTLVEWHDVVKKQNDKAEKQKYFMPNRADKRAAKKRKAKR